MPCVSQKTLKRNALASRELTLQNELRNVRAELYSMEHDMPYVASSKDSKISQWLDFIAACVLTVSVCVAAGAVVWCLVAAALGL